MLQGMPWYCFCLCYRRYFRQRETMRHVHHASLPANSKQPGWIVLGPHAHVTTHNCGVRVRVLFSASCAGRKRDAGQQVRASGGVVVKKLIIHAYLLDYEFWCQMCSLPKGQVKAARFARVPALRCRATRHWTEWYLLH